jgi:hypothetical protein
VLPGERRDTLGLRRQGGSGGVSSETNDPPVPLVPMLPRPGEVRHVPTPLLRSRVKISLGVRPLASAGGRGLRSSDVLPIPCSAIFFRKDLLGVLKRKIDLSLFPCHEPLQVEGKNKNEPTIDNAQKAPPGTHSSTVHVLFFCLMFLTTSQLVRMGHKNQNKRLFFCIFFLGEFFSTASSSSGR